MLAKSVQDAIERNEYLRANYKTPEKVANALRDALEMDIVEQERYKFDSGYERVEYNVVTGSGEAVLRIQVSNSSFGNNLDLFQVSGVTHVCGIAELNDLL
jgi:hypothetical protein